MMSWQFFMDMTLQLLIFSPVYLTLFWFFTYLLFNKKGGASVFAYILFFFALVYFFTDCTFSSSLPSMGLLTVTVLLAQFFAPCIIPLAMTYLWHIYSGKPYSKANFLWICLPFALFMAELALIYVIGIPKYTNLLLEHVNQGGIPSNLDAPSRALFFCSVYLFRFILAFEVMTFLIRFSVDLVKGRLSFKNTWSFFFHNGSIQAKHMEYLCLLVLLLLYVVKIVIPRGIMVDHPWFPALFSVIICIPVYFFGLFGLYNENRMLRLSDVSFLQTYEDSEEEENEAFYEDLETSYAEPALDNHAASEDTADAKSERGDRAVPAQVPFNSEDLRERFEYLMITEKMYLTQGITLTDIADRLNSNKTYVSRLVNTVYGLPFPEYLNTLRIDYAEEYILHNRDAKQNEIAAACGFPSASAFNNTFKKITGVTPKIWLAMRNK